MIRLHYHQRQGASGVWVRRLGRLAAVGIFGVAFYVYCGTRAAGENVGFSAGISLVSLVMMVYLCVAPAVLIWAIVVQCVVMSQRERLFVEVVVLWLVAALIGSVAGEGWLLADEWRFDAEVRAATGGGATSYSRDRAWPATGCSLVFRAGIGVTATD